MFFLLFHTLSCTHQALHAASQVFQAGKALQCSAAGLNERRPCKTVCSLPPLPQFLFLSLGAWMVQMKGSTVLCFKERREDGWRRHGCAGGLWEKPGPLKAPSSRRLHSNPTTQPSNYASVHWFASKARPLVQLPRRVFWTCLFFCKAIKKKKKTLLALRALLNTKLLFLFEREWLMKRHVT